jgi:protein SCO1/2
MNRRAMRRAVRLAISALLLLPAACAVGEEPARPPLEGARIGGNFSLVDKTGKPVRFNDLAGKYRVVYFGYTFCPDVCPLDVQKLMQGYNRFAKAEPQVAERVQPIFISIDPERDTPQVVGQFTGAFSPKLVGLTGSTEQVAEAVKMFASYAKKGPVTPEGGYLMDHMRTAYLMAPDGKPIALLPVEQGPEVIAADLARWTS